MPGKRARRSTRSSTSISDADSALMAPHMVYRLRQQSRSPSPAPATQSKKSKQRRGSRSSSSMSSSASASPVVDSNVYRRHAVAQFAPYLRRTDAVPQNPRAMVFVSDSEGMDPVPAPRKRVPPPRPPPPRRPVPAPRQRVPPVPAPRQRVPPPVPPRPRLAPVPAPRKRVPPPIPPRHVPPPPIPPRSSSTQQQIFPPMRLPSPDSLLGPTEIQSVYATPMGWVETPPASYANFRGGYPRFVSTWDDRGQPVTPRSFF